MCYFIKAACPYNITEGLLGETLYLNVMLVNQSSFILLSCKVPDH